MEWSHWQDHPAADGWRLRFLMFTVKSGYDSLKHEFDFPSQAVISSTECTYIALSGSAVLFSSNHRIEDFEDVAGNEFLFPGRCPEVRYSFRVPLSRQRNNELDAAFQSLFNMLPRSFENRSLDGSVIGVLDLARGGECRSMLVINGALTRDGGSSDSTAALREWTLIYSLIFKLFRDPSAP